MEICERLKEMRKNAGLTQEQAAEKINVSRVTLSHWENGRSLPDIASLISLSDLYNVSLDELVKEDRKMTDKVKRDSKNAGANARLTRITSILVLVVLAVYISSVFIGGGFKDFCEAAVKWVLLGIGFAAIFTYIGQEKK